MFSLIDVFILLTLCGFVCFGFFFGFVHTIGNLLGTILGIIFTAQLAGPVYDRLGFLIGTGVFGHLAVFFFVFFLVSRILGLLFWLLGKVLGVLTMIPFAGFVDRLLGGALGFVEGIVFVVVLLSFAVQYVPATTLDGILAHSSLASILLAIAAAFNVLYASKTT